QPEVGEVVAALARARLPDLHQELAVARELQHHVVAERLHAADLTFVLLAVLPGGRLTAPGRWRRCAAAVPTNPDVALVVDRDALIRVGPVVPLTGTSPV